MSQIYAMTSQHDGAALMLRRALHIFDCAFHPLFLASVTEGHARMDIDGGSQSNGSLGQVPQGGGSQGNSDNGDNGNNGAGGNRSLFTALQRHAHLLGKTHH